MIQEAETNDKAGSTVSNLKRRKVRIPEPDGNWEFTQRGQEVWAIYHAPVKRTSKRRSSKRQSTRRT
jgi:hypothetical protein